jgi:aryl-alcohol dehydrogenase-like predicted oxidoreductase
MNADCTTGTGAGAQPTRPLTRRDLISRGLGAAVALAWNQPRQRTPPEQEPLRRRIPSSGEELPVVGLGTWQTFDVGAGEAERKPRRDVLARFAGLGGTVIDSSPMYGRAEGVVGELVTELGLRPRLFLATKVWTRGRAEGEQQMRTSLQRLRTERIELLQVHNLLDVAAHLETLAVWQREGRVRYVGITHYTAGAHAQLERIMSAHPLDFVQVNYSLAERDAERRLLPLAAERGIAVLINRPFAEGALFSRVRGRTLPAAAAEYGARSWAQFFLKWIVAHPAVTCVIPATSDPAHLEDNMGALRGPLPDAAGRERMAKLFEQA